MKFPAVAGSVLDSLTRNMGIHDRLGSYRVWQVWKEVVGPQTAQHAQPLRLRDGVLVVRVDHPVWMQQLQLLKPRILERLNRAITPSVLADIHLSHGKTEMVLPAPRADEELLPPLSQEARREIDRILPPDEDDLHEAWRNLLAQHFQSKSRPRP